MGVVEGCGDMGWWGGGVVGGRKVEVEMWGCDVGPWRALRGVRGQGSEIRGQGVEGSWGRWRFVGIWGGEGVRRWRWRCGAAGGPWRGSEGGQRSEVRGQGAEGSWGRWRVVEMWGGGVVG